VHDYLGRFAFADSRNPPLRSDVHVAAAGTDHAPANRNLRLQCDSDYGTLSEESDQVLLAGTPERDRRWTIAALAHNLTVAGVEPSGPAAPVQVFQ
jgi:hypothetical protein